jgi:hypothetical protein
MPWDDEDEDPGWGKTTIHQAPPVPAVWEGEDQDEDGEGQTWDADDKPAGSAAAGASKVVPGPRALTKRQLLAKKEEEERKARAAREAAAEAHKDDPEWQKLTKEQQKKAEEAADLSLTVDAFGGSGVVTAEREFKSPQLDKDNVDMAGGDMTALKKELDNIKSPNPLDNVQLKTAQDYKNFAEKTTDMALKAGDQKLILEFLTAVIDRGTKRMKLDDVAALSTKLAAILALKQKAEKPVKKPSASAKKGSLSVGKAVATGTLNYHDRDEYYDDFAV